MLLSDLADDRIRAADQGQAVVDPEIIGLGPLLEHPPQLKTLWCPRFPDVPAIRPIPHAGPRDHVLSGCAESGLRHTRRGEMLRGLCLCLLVRLRHMHMARQEGARQGAGVTTLFPELTPGGEFLGDHGSDMDVLRDVEIVACRICEA